MALSRQFKARFLGEIRPMVLVYASLALAVLVLGLHAASLVSLLLGGATWPAFPWGVAFAPLLLVHAGRWWALQAGWSEVCVGELSRHTLAFAARAEAEPGDSPNTLDGSPFPLPMQAELARAVMRRGWLSWREVLDAAAAAAAGVRGPVAPMWMMIGGYRSPVARRADWERVLSPLAWRAARLDRAWAPAVEEAAPRPRL